MLIPLALNRDQPLQQQLYEQLRLLVQNARLRPGARMPSSRMLADQFGISRVTVLLVYERLIAEGIVETLPARGTFVASVVPRPEKSEGGRLAEREMERAQPRPFGRPDSALFPFGRWRSLMRQALDTMGAQAAPPHPAGDPALREAIALWLSVSRGLAVSAEQIVLVSSRQQGLHLAAHLVHPAGGQVLLEDPCDPAAAAALGGDGRSVARIPVDAEGIVTAALPAAAGLLHVTPGHQRPLGVMLSAARREALLAWAASCGALVLEDDCDGELRYGAGGLPSLMALDTQSRVIMLGGFCLSLGPWVQLAYLVLPRELVAAAVAARRSMDDNGTLLEHTALTGLLRGGFYARHLHRIGKVYAARRAAMLGALKRHFDAHATIWGADAGLHLAWFAAPSLGTAAEIAAQAHGCGLDAECVPGRQAVLLGFGSLSEQQIAPRVARLAALLVGDDAPRAQAAD